MKLYDCKHQNKKAPYRGRENTPSNPNPPPPLARFRLLGLGRFASLLAPPPPPPRRGMPGTPLVTAYHGKNGKNIAD